MLTADYFVQLAIIKGRRAIEKRFAEKTPE
jgi:hypothetical protein